MTVLLPLLLLLLPPPNSYPPPPSPLQASRPTPSLTPASSACRMPVHTNAWLTCSLLQLMLLLLRRSRST